MIRTKNIVLSAIIALGALVTLAVQQAPAQVHTAKVQRQTGLALMLTGTAVGEARVIDGVEMVCFDIDLVDPATGRVIGTGTDCLDLNSITGDPTAGGFSISNTTFFNLPSGTIKSRNRTTIQPILEGSPGLTHLTGDVAQQPNILAGSGQYKGVQGIARLNGAVDMSQFFSDGVIGFNCVFRLELQ